MKKKWEDEVVQINIGWEDVASSRQEQKEADLSHSFTRWSGGIDE